MSDSRRYVLVWIAAAFLGVNIGAGVLVLAMAAVDSWLHWSGTARTAGLWAVFVVAAALTTHVIGRALVRVVARQLNERT